MKNPLNLNIGDTKRIKAISTLEYDADGHKELVRAASLQTVTICGCVVRCTGKYFKPSGYLDDYCPAEFKTKNRITFYECRTQIDSKPFLVHPEDIVHEL